MYVQIRGRVAKAELLHFLSRLVSFSRILLSSSFRLSTSLYVSSIRP